MFIQTDSSTGTFSARELPDLSEKSRVSNERRRRERMQPSASERVNGSPPPTLCKPETRGLKPAATNVSDTFSVRKCRVMTVAAGFGPRVSGLKSVGGGIRLHVLRAGGDSRRLVDAR